MNHIESISEMIHVTPSDTNLYLERGKAFLEAEMFTESACDLMYYEQCMGENKEYLKYLGIALYKTSSQYSLERLITYLDLFPDDVAARQYLADIYFERGEIEKSKAHYEEAVKKGLDCTIIKDKFGNTASDCNAPKKKRLFWR
jgi:tetratricopeptide (TPR) repeat protein